MKNLKFPLSGKILCKWVIKKTVQNYLSILIVLGSFWTFIWFMDLIMNMLVYQNINVNPFNSYFLGIKIVFIISMYFLFPSFWFAMEGAQSTEKERKEWEYSHSNLL